MTRVRASTPAIVVFVRAMRQKRDALAVAVQVARSLEPISNEETVLEMLEDCAIQLGFAESSDPAQFLLKIIHAMNTSNE